MFKHTQTILKAVLADLAPNKKSYVFGNVNAFGSMYSAMLNTLALMFYFTLT